MHHLLAVATNMATHVWRSWTTVDRLGTIAVIALAYLFWAAAARRRDGRWPGIGRDFITDLAYWLFYAAGIFGILGGKWIFAALQHGLHRIAPFLELNLLAGKPAWLQIVVLAIASDFVSYWWHRWSHASTILWSFHRAHHSQTQLMPLTNYRVHVGDMIVRGTLLMFPATILGADARWFIGVLWAQTFLNVLAHADLDWSFGPIGYLFVSPRYHRVHHAEDAELSGHNFGILMSSWDFLFRTATSHTERPERFGVAGEQIPRGFLAQQIDPLVVLYRRLRPQRPPLVAPSEATGS